MHVDNERGQLALGSLKVGVDGRVVEAVCLLAVRSLPRDHLSSGDQGGGNLGLRRRTQHLRLAARHLNNRWRVRGGVSQEDDTAVSGGDVTDGPPAGRPFLGHTVVDAYGTDVPHLVLGPRAHQVVVVEVVVGVQAEMPVWV